MSALNKAIYTENRRIKREVQIKRAGKLAVVDIPKFKRIDLRDRIKQLYARILTTLKKPELEKISYSKLIGNVKEEKIACFLPLLHLNDSRKLWLEQEKHLDEIYIFLYEYFEKNREKFLEELEENIEEMKKELVTENLNEPAIKKALEKNIKLKQEKIRLEKEIKKELIKELKEVNAEISCNPLVEISGSKTPKNLTKSKEIFSASNKKEIVSDLGIEKEIESKKEINKTNKNL